MEIHMIQASVHMSNKNKYLKQRSTPAPTKRPTTKTMTSPDYLSSNKSANMTNFTMYDNYLMDLNSTYLWNSSDVFNITNTTDMSLDYDYQMINGNLSSTVESWSFCKEWTPAQHNLFQTAHFFFAAAFLVPGSFKQSVLLVRALLSVGYIFLTFWAGFDICAPDIMLWNLLLVILNLTHTALLTWRFLPPTLTLELTELYLKVFKPFKVTKKHFKELVREAHVVNLERGDIYAVEDVSPADERLSILLKGKMRVTCDDTHLHFINVHQFVDSPEWEANHEQSDDVFQVTITAEEDCVYLCWSRMRLERVLRHRPMLKVILDSLIGKDITQKLYSLNEHLCGLDDEREREKRDEIWAKAHKRSMSMDAVNTGTTGLVRSKAYRQSNRKHSLNSSNGRLQQQCWVPLVAKQFPIHSPFMQKEDESSQQKSLLLVPDITKSPQRTRSFKRNREVKFQKLLK